jgi:hypothetical protein
MITIIEIPKEYLLVHNVCCRRNAQELTVDVLLLL